MRSEARLFRQLNQKLHRLIRYSVLRIVKKYSASLDGESLATRGIIDEHLTKPHLPDLLIMPFQTFQAVSHRAVSSSSSYQCSLIFLVSRNELSFECFNIQIRHPIQCGSPQQSCQHDAASAVLIRLRSSRAPALQCRCIGLRRDPRSASSASAARIAATIVGIPSSGFFSRTLTLTITCGNTLRSADEFCKRFATAMNNIKKQERGKQPVASSAPSGEYNVAGLFAA